MRKILAAAVTLAALFIAISPAASQPSAPKPAPVAASANWTQAGGGGHHQSSADIEIGDGRFGEVWRRKPRVKSLHFSAPVAADGVVCIAASRGVEAFSARTGQALWMVEYEKEVTLPPVICGGNVVLQHGEKTSGDTRVECYSLQQGRKLWGVDVPGVTNWRNCAPLADDSGVYVMTQLEDGAMRLAALNIADGKARFVNDRLWDVFAQPAVDGGVLAVYSGGRFQFFDTTTGKLTYSWAHEFHTPIRRDAYAPLCVTRLVMARGRCFLGSNDCVVGAEYAPPHKHWISYTSCAGAPAVMGAELYCTGNRGQLNVLDVDTGDSTRMQTAHYSGRWSIIALRDGLVYVQSHSISICRRNGELVQTLEDFDSPCVHGGFLFAVTEPLPRLVKLGLRPDAASAMPATHGPDLTLPLQGDWPTPGGGPERRGVATGALAGREAVLCWERDLGMRGTLECAAGGSVFCRLNQNNVLASFDAVTGAPRWRLLADSSWGPPSAGGGGVFAVNSIYEDVGSEYLHAMRVGADDGRMSWRHELFSGDVGEPSAPLLSGQTAWFTTSSTGVAGVDMGGLGAQGGCVLPSGVGMASDGESIYAWDMGSSEFHVLDAKSGKRRWAISLERTGEAHFRDVTLAPAICNNMAYIATGTELFAVNLATRKPAWRVSGAFTSAPAVDGQAVAVGLGDKLKLYAPAGGEALGEANLEEFKANWLVRQPILTEDSFIVTDSRATFIIDRKTLKVRQSLPLGGSMLAASGGLLICNATQGGGREPVRLQRYEFRKVGPAELPVALNIMLEAEEDEWVDFRLLGNAGADAGLVAYAEAPYEYDEFFTAGADGLPERMVRPKLTEAVGYSRPGAEKSVRMFARLASKKGVKEPHTVKLKYVLSDGRRFSEPAFVTIRVHPRGALSTALELWTVENVPVTGKIASLSGAAFPNAVLGTTMPRADGAFIYTPARDRLDNDYFLVPGGSASGVQRVRVNIVQGCDRQPAITSKAPDKAKAGASWSYDFTLQCDDAVSLDAVKALIGGIAPPQIRIEGELRREGRKLSGRLVWDKAWEGYENLTSVRFALMAIDTAGRSGDVQWIELKRE
ncbi:MAG: PQQ-binding-like beta-propeller repeat protein [Planctomycetes bacterium]|nr:PQQ-binding-like beta-propeller repeat protein [Planctomycetota bacterium]